MNHKKKILKIIITANILLYSSLALAVPQKINSAFIGTWCDGVEAQEITSSHIIGMDGRSNKVLISVVNLTVNTPKKISGTFKYEESNTLIKTTYAFKNKKLYEYFYMEGKLMSNELYRCNL